MKKEMYLATDLYDEIKDGVRADFEQGDVIQYLTNSGEIIDYRVQQEFAKTSGENANYRAVDLSNHWFEALGNVTDVISEIGEPARANLGLVKIEVPTDNALTSTEWVFACYTAVVYDSKTGMTYECPLSEVNIGDRAFFRGAARYMTMYIYR